MGVDVASRRDVFGGKADDLSEFQDRLALLDALDRHFVTAHDARGRPDTLRGHLGHHGVDGHDDVVLGIELERARGLLFRLVLHKRLPGIFRMMRSERSKRKAAHDFTLCHHHDCAAVLVGKHKGNGERQ